MTPRCDGRNRTALHTRQMFLNAAAVAGCRCATGGAVIAADGEQPVIAGPVVFAQDRGGDREIPVRVQQFAGVIETVRLVADIDLPQTNVDARRRHLPQRAPQVCAGGFAGLEPPCLAGDILGPGPRSSLPAQRDAAFLQGHGVQHRRGNAGVVRGQLIGRRRNLPRQDGRGPDSEAEQAQDACPAKAH